MAWSEDDENDRAAPSLTRTSLRSPSQVLTWHVVFYNYAMLLSWGRAVDRLLILSQSEFLVIPPPLTAASMTVSSGRPGLSTGASSRLAKLLASYTSWPVLRVKRLDALGRLGVPGDDGRRPLTWDSDPARDARLVCRPPASSQSPALLLDPQEVILVYMHEADVLDITSADGRAGKTSALDVPGYELFALSAVDQPQGSQTPSTGVKCKPLHWNWHGQGDVDI